MFLKFEFLILSESWCTSTEEKGRATPNLGRKLSIPCLILFQPIAITLPPIIICLLGNLLFDFLLLSIYPKLNEVKPSSVIFGLPRNLADNQKKVVNQKR